MAGRQYVVFISTISLTEYGTPNVFTNNVVVDPCADDYLAFVVLVEICTDDGLTGTGEITD